MPQIPALAFNAANVAILLAIFYGVAVHARRTLHARIMTTCFLADLAMVALIEIQRKAIEQAVGPTSGLMKLHIAVSALAIVLWIPQILTGRAILRGKPRLRRHRVQAWAFLLFRCTNVVTAFFVDA